MLKKRVLFLIVCIGLYAQAYAASKPQELHSIIVATKPYSEAALKRFVFYAYDAQLWTDAKPWSYENPFALSLIYHMSFSTQELADKSIEEMEGLQALSAKQKQSYLSILTKAFPNVKEGDRITAVYKPKSGVDFYYNGKLTTSNGSSLFARRFLDIWLSENTSEPRLRKQLLGEKK